MYSSLHLTELSTVQLKIQNTILNLWSKRSSLQQNWPERCEERRLTIFFLSIVTGEYELSEQIKRISMQHCSTYKDTAGLLKSQYCVYWDTPVQTHSGVRRLWNWVQRLSDRAEEAFQLLLGFQTVWIRRSVQPTPEYFIFSSFLVNFLLCWF